MDPRDYPWHRFEPQGPQYYPPRPSYPQRSRDRDGYYRTGHNDDAYYPHRDPRVKQWPALDPRSGKHVIRPPPPRPDFTPDYWSGPATRPGYDSDRTSGRAHSRQGYEHHPHNYSSWDTREDYGYYDHGYHTGHYQHPDAVRWTQQDYWGSGPYQDQRYEQDWTGTAYPDQYRINQQTDNGNDFNSPDRDHARENGEGSGQASLYGTGTLAESKTSGLSSSSYELSQYIDGTDQNDLPPQSRWSPSKTDVSAYPRVEAPLKHCLPHVRASFGPTGQLVRVSPSLASQGEPALVELHSLEIILVETQDQQELRDFPGPLAREDLHKVDAISFALKRAESCLKDTSLQDSASAALLWQLLVLLCRQNGRIVGSDIAELLTRGSRAPGKCDGEVGLSDGPSLIDLSEDPTPETEVLEGPDLLTGAPAPSIQSADEDLQKYAQLLLAGRKKEALESAMKSGLWGHALFLASKMDNRSYTAVLNRFTGSLAASDPLQTLFQLLSGRIPAVATSCLSEKWGDWKPHLAVMLSNETGDSALHQKAIITMGDTLATRGVMNGAQFCYLTARAPFGVYTSRTDRLVLLGSTHSLPFRKFARNAAVQCTEVFEYSQRLGNATFFIPSFQVYKFLYACRLLDYGLASQAFHYCEVIGKALLGQEVSCAVLLGEVIKLAERLKQSEPQSSDADAHSPTREPEWLAQLRLRQGGQMGSYGYSDTSQSAAEENALANQENGVYPDPYAEDQEFPTGGMVDDVQPPDTLCPQFEGAIEQQVSHPWPQQPIWQAHSQPATLPVVGGQQYNHQFDHSTYPPTAPLNPPLNHHPLACQGDEIQLCTVGDLQLNGPEPITEGEGGGNHLTANQDRKAEEKNNLQPEKSTKSGWFSGWFKSKPHDVQKDTPAPPLFSTPPPSATIPAMFPPPPTSTGINPFSKKAGRPQSAMQGQVPFPSSTSMGLP
ncbi:protein transport protein Sec16B isoform X2 [Conger conger]|uniref:protein transport protein Sec16B isoform X2 n=1 Tax=Conger conger TaxID=82655 RepID=UPI002A59BD74|nr:protein transport protein Sec16B isoform X2 [Conger conger]